MSKLVKMEGVREYSEEYCVELRENEHRRLVVRAYNEGTCNFTEVDLVDLVLWLSANGIVRLACYMPETQDG